MSNRSRMDDRSLSTVRWSLDVVEHPAFRRTIQSVGTLFDFASRPDNVDLMTFETPDGRGQRANRIWQLPLSYEDLVVRRRALEAWAELHGGFLGRAPDHVASCLSGMVMGIDVFEAYDRARAGRSRTITDTPGTTISISPT